MQFSPIEDGPVMIPTEVALGDNGNVSLVPLETH